MEQSKDSPADPAETIATEIRARIGGLTPSERRAAHALLANYPFIGLETVSQFAKRAGVSAPSILRFIGRFGFGSYADFQRRLTQELEAQVQSPLKRQANVSGPGAHFAEFVGAVTENVTGTFDALAPAEFDAILAVLADPKRRIRFVGGRFTEALAIYMARHLRVIRADVSLMEGHAATWRDQVIDFGRRDVLMVFDIRRYQEDVVALAREAARRGATVICFTDRWLSPATRVARHVVAARCAVPSNWDSSLAILAVVEALLAKLTRETWESAKPRIEAVDLLRGGE
jgi:DNA-binding MurR/RpiR family transcriptional regulator